MLLTMRAAAPRSGSAVSPSSTTGAVPLPARRPAAARCAVPARRGAAAPARRARSRRGRRGARRGAGSRRRTRASPPRPRRGFSWNSRYISSTRPALGPRSLGDRCTAASLDRVHCPASCHRQRRTSSARRKARSSAWRAFSRGSQTRLVARFEVFAAHFVAAAEALGDVVAGELDVHAARPHVVRAAARRRTARPRASPRRSGASCSRSRARTCCRASGRTPTRPGGRRAAPRAGAAGRCSATLSAPMRLTSVSRPGSRPGSRRRHSSTSLSGVDVGPSFSADRVLHAGEELARARRRAGGCARRSRAGARSSRTSRR